MHVYASKIEYAEHIVLVKGDINTDEPVWVRMHALDVLYDVLGDTHEARESDLHPAMEKIAAHGSGVIVLLRRLSQRRVRADAGAGACGQPAQLQPAGLRHRRTNPA